jgi:hypothetical protein
MADKIQELTRVKSNIMSENLPTTTLIQNSIESQVLLESKREDKQQEFKPNFSKYGKIPNHNSKLTLQEVNDKGLNGDDMIWVGTEKIHGSNCPLCTDGTSVILGKRGSFLGGTPLGEFRQWRSKVQKRS